ncbi:hypothetical protein CEP52_017594, partial [Fusarium oligoseptatum]
MAPSPPPPFGPLRLASPADDPRIGNVASAGFHSSPVFHYERPNHAGFPEDTVLSYCHEFLYLIKSHEYIVLVATDKFDPNEGEKTQAIIPANGALPIPKPDDEVVVALYPKLPENRKRDMNEDNCDALEKCCQAAEKRYFQGPTYTLEMVVVHPAYQKRGHGRRLVQWGIKLATKDKVGVGVIAAGKGKSLYGSLGFEKLGDLPFEGLGLSVMQYRANPLRLHLWLFTSFVLL